MGKVKVPIKNDMQLYLLFSTEGLVGVSLLFSEDVVHQICSGMCNSVNNTVDSVQEEVLKLRVFSSSLTVNSKKSSQYVNLSHYRKTTCFDDFQDC